MAPPILAGKLHGQGREAGSLQDGKLGFWQDTARGSLGGRSEDTEVPLYFVPATQRVKQPDDGVLHISFSTPKSFRQLTLSIPLPDVTDEARPRFLISLPTFFTSNSKATLEGLLRTAERGFEGDENARAEDLVVRRMDAGRGREVIRFMVE